MKFEPALADNLQMRASLRGHGRIVVVAAVAIAALSACGGGTTKAGPASPTTHTSQAPATTSTTTAVVPLQASDYEPVLSDLRNAMTAEKTYYTDNMAYTGDISMLRSIEPSLHWGSLLHVVLAGDGAGMPIGQFVCLQESTRLGMPFAIADIATGSHAGTYFARSVCSANAADVLTWGTNGWLIKADGTPA